MHRCAAQIRGLPMLRGRALSAALALLLLPPACLAAGPVYAACTSPAGQEADIIYNAGYSTYQFCDNTNWQGFGGGQTCSAVSTGYIPTTYSTSNNGYFVLTSTTYNGNLGGMFGANALCLTELTTNTNWKGYATANSNGQLIASKVFAFLCTRNGWCQNLLPLTTYYFAHVGDAAAGGASFTTDSIGQGPNDNADWAAANYFSTSTNYWSYRFNSVETNWILGSSSGNTCASDWTQSSSGSTGSSGHAAQINHRRWASGSPTCDITLPIICFVNP